MNLSLLILTIPQRASMLARLMDGLEPQRLRRPGEVEIKILTTKYRVGTIGDHRNRLLDMASGDYLAFIDDDDTVPDYYIESLLDAIHNHSPDVVGWWMARYVDGVYVGYGVHSIANRHYSRSNDGRFMRPPTHLNAVRSDLAKDTAFPSRDSGEDVSYAMKLLPKLKTEQFIPKFMYNYLYVQTANREEVQLTYNQRPC